MDDAKIMRYAHSEGHTDLCYDDSGRYLITCGTEGDIRIWDGFDDDFPQSHHMGEVVHAVSFKKNNIYLSSDVNSVVAYTFPKVEPDGIIAHFNSSVYHIACSKKGNYIAAGGSDFAIKAVNLTDRSNHVFRGHDAPILSVVIDPDEKYLASSSCDGTVRVWNMSDQLVIKMWNNVLKKSNDFCTSQTICRLDWHPTNGKFLAVPVDKEVKLYVKETWECHLTLTDDCITEMVNICTFSPSGEFLAAATINGWIVVWDLGKNTQCIARKSHEKGLKICSLVWNPSRAELALCDIEGQLGIFEDIDNSKKTEEIQENEHTDQMKSDLPEESDEDLDMLFDKATPEKRYPQADGKKSLQRINSDSNFNEDDDDFDISAIKAKLEPKIFGTQDELGEDIQSSAVASEIVQPPVESKPAPVEIPSTPLQTSFQPSSTPLHLDHRFMLWNSIGIVRCYNTEEENSVDVEFHDTSIYHPVHMNNTQGHTMAALSSEALLLASPKGDDSPSKLQCLHIGTWDSNKEWSIDMPEDEEIDAISLGSGWAAAATDKRFLHLFTVSGVQCEVFCIPGPAVCLAATDNQLAIAYHLGPAIPGEQNLGLLTVDIKNKSCHTTKNYPLPLSSKAFLAWMGYTDEGLPCTVDTSGIVRILSIKHSCKWSPVANTKSHTKGLSDHYFVVGVSEIQQEIRCIPCKGSRYPSMLPRPTVTVLTFGMPFCDMKTDKGRLEEEHGRLSLLHRRIKSLLGSGFDLDSEMSNNERKWTDVLLKMFALATRTEREYRAMDIAELMPTTRAVQGAIKYATQRHHMALAERLGEVIHRKLAEEYASVDSSDEDQEMDDTNNPTKEPPANYRHRDSFFSGGNDEVIVQPKPLSTSRFSLSKEQVYRRQSLQLIDDAAMDVSTGEHPKNVQDHPVVNSNNQSNPFKIQPNKKSNQTPLANKQLQNNIDEMLGGSTRRLSSGQRSVFENHVMEEKKVPQQSKLCVSSNKNSEAGIPRDTPNKKFGFPLFLEENKEKIRAENPEADKESIIKIATRHFRDLPTEEKQKYKKSSQENNTAVETHTGKRKHISDESEPTSTGADEVIQPKPLPAKEREHQSSQLRGDTGTDIPTEQRSKKTNTHTSNNSSQSNPFKIQSNIKSDQSPASQKQLQGSIDEMLSESTRRLSSGPKSMSVDHVAEVKKVSQQSKLFLSSNKTPEFGKSKDVATNKLGFPLFLEANREKIKAENPDADEESIVTIATKLFRDLPSEEKQKCKKSSQEKNATVKTPTTKRKHNCDENEPSPNNSDKKSKSVKEKAKVLSATTASKLTMFAFSKTEY